MIADYLKNADKYILQRDFDAAEREVAKAIEVEPDNLYALAYMERVKYFREESVRRPQAPLPPEPPKPPGGKKKAAAAAPVKQEPSKPTVYIIDDEPDYLNMLEVVLSGAGYQVVTEETPDGAVSRLESFVPDLILCDMNFDNSELNGLSIYESVRKNPKLLAVPFVFITGVKDDEVIRTTMERGADDLIAKPFSRDMLIAMVDGKIKRFRELRKMAD
jgi:CheY-like chemotaxis protein